MAFLLNFHWRLVILSLLLLSIEVQCLEDVNATTRISAGGPGFYGAQQVMRFLGMGGQTQDDVHSTYLKQSIQAELKRRLSPNSRILLDGDEDFHLVNARYTNYRRPTFIAGVKVVEENDVVETVCRLLVTRSRRVADSLGELCPLTRHPVRGPYWWSFSYDFIKSNPRRDCH